MTYHDRSLRDYLTGRFSGDERRQWRGRFTSGVESEWFDTIEEAKAWVVQNRWTRGVWASNGEQYLIYYTCEFRYSKTGELLHYGEVMASVGWRIHP